MSRFLVSAFAGFLALAISAASPQAAAAPESVTVIRSTTAGIAPGDVLREGERITLKEDESLEVLSITGVRTSIDGPYDGPLKLSGGSEVTQSRMSALGDAILGRGRGTKVLGATRGAPKPDGAEGAGDEPEEELEGPAILIDISVDGTWCAVKDVPLYLSREGFGRLVGSLTDEETGKTVELKWNHFRQAVAWPAEIEARDGGVYHVLVEGGDPVVIKLRDFLPTDKPAADLARMSQMQCKVQVERALDEMTAEE